MRRGRMLGVSVIAIGACLLSTATWASGPEAGLNLGAAIPLSKYRRTVDGNVGGTFGIEGGYRFTLTDNVALSLLGNPQFTFFPTEPGCCSGKNDHEVGSVFGITAGPRLSFLADDLEIYLGSQGGYYRDMSGPMSDDGIGFNGNTGINFAVARHTSVGLYGRYDYANLVAAPGTDDNRQWVSAGVSLQYVFEPEPAMAQTPPPPAPPAPAPPKPTRKIVLRGVNFDFDKSTIRPDARSILDEAVRMLQDEASIHISVEGHTDAIGTDAYNQRLSERRARAVADYLAGGGIAPSRMSTTGYGESKPVASNATDEGRAQNRRVELRILEH
jgi:outer membrane protein OmpA-like peptidoglycan-associated protein